MAPGASAGFCGKGSGGPSGRGSPPGRPVAPRNPRPVRAQPGASPAWGRERPARQQLLLLPPRWLWQQRAPSYVQYTRVGVRGVTEHAQGRSSGRFPPAGSAGPPGRSAASTAGGPTAGAEGGLRSSAGGFRGGPSPPGRAPPSPGSGHSSGRRSRSPPGGRRHRRLNRNRLAGAARGGCSCGCRCRGGCGAAAWVRAWSGPAAARGRGRSAAAPPAMGLCFGGPCAACPRRRA